MRYCIDLCVKFNWVIGELLSPYNLILKENFPLVETVLLLQLSSDVFQAIMFLWALKCIWHGLLYVMFEGCMRGSRLPQAQNFPCEVEVQLCSTESTVCIS